MHAFYHCSYLIGGKSSSFIQNIEYVIQNTYAYLSIHNVWRGNQEIVDFYVSLPQTILLR